MTIQEKLLAHAATTETDGPFGPVKAWFWKFEGPHGIKKVAFSIDANKFPNDGGKAFEEVLNSALLSSARAIAKEIGYSGNLDEMEVNFLIPQK
jgi:hypothetical protein